VAARAVRESLVLLKNDKGLLPLKPGAKVFVSGPLADNVGWQSGGWTINWQGGYDKKSGKKVTRLTPGTSILEGLQALAKAGGGEVITDAARAREASVAVVVVGETPYAEMQGDIQRGSAMTLDSPGRFAPGNLEAIQVAKDAGLPVVVVLVSGRPLIVTEELAGWNALVEAWLPGSEGAAVAEVLYGKVDFRGKLPVTWPRNVGDLPAAGSANPLFPYGFGLTLAH
jgi:beta-glucosidase